LAVLRHLSSRITGFWFRSQTRLSEIRLRTDEFFLKTVLVLAVIVLAASFAFNLSLYGNIPDHWKVTIRAFIIFLPFCYFLQALLNVKSYKEQHVSKVQKDFREYYFLIQRNVRSVTEDFVTTPMRGPAATPTSTESPSRKASATEIAIGPNIGDGNWELHHKIKRSILLDDVTFRELFHNIAEEIRDVTLYDYYQKAYQIYIKKEEEFVEKEIRKELVIRWYDISEYKLILMISEIKRQIITAATTTSAPPTFTSFEEQIIREVLEARSNLLDQIVLKRSDLLRFELGDIVDDIVEGKMHGEGINFRSYFLPLSFFLFIYFAGFLITIPLISSIFGYQTEANKIVLPLFDINKYIIPFQAIQWGFLGGFVYTSISLLNRFLRKDLLPRVYFYASFRLLLSSVVAIIIYFFYMLADPKPTGINEFMNINPAILLLCFLAGVAPIQFLINFADSQMTKIYKGWRRRRVAGNRHITQIAGIDSITADRLSEEGISSVEQLALINPKEIEEKTKFSLQYITDWKDQAILYLLTDDRVVPQGKSKKKNPTLYDKLGENLGIRTMSSLLKLWDAVKKNDTNNSKEQTLYESLDLMADDKNDFIQFHYLFTNIIATSEFYYKQFEEKKLILEE
jgi:hypothetical protein